MGTTEGVLGSDSVNKSNSDKQSKPPSPWLFGIVAAIFATGAVIGGYYLGEYIPEHGLGSGSEGITNGRIIGAVSGGLVSIIITSLICRCIYKSDENKPIIYVDGHPVIVHRVKPITYQVYEGHSWDAGLQCALDEQDVPITQSDSDDDQSPLEPSNKANPAA